MSKLWKNVLLMGVNCPIGEAIASKLTPFTANLTTIKDANHFKSKVENNVDKHFDVIINNVFASLNVHQWLTSESKQFDALTNYAQFRWLHISPFPMKFGSTLIPEALPWSTLAFRLSANTNALKYYCRSEKVIAEAAMAVLQQQEQQQDVDTNVTGNVPVTTVESVLNNSSHSSLLKTSNVLVKGSFHVSSNSDAFIDHESFESQQLMLI